MKKQENSKAEDQTRSEKPPPSAATPRPVTVLHVDDDPDDTTLLQVACARADVNFDLQNIGDGEQVIQYLSGAGKYADRTLYRFPGLVLLDLKMPRVEGLEILKWIRDQPALKHLPVVVLSGSELQEDIRKAYDVGANSYLVKPPSLNSLINLVKDIGARLPASF